MKRKLPLLCIFGLVFLISCQSIEKLEKPKNLIPEDKMAEVLIDLAIAKSARSVNKKIFIEKGVHPVTYIYKKHQIDSTSFIESNKWYSANLEAYEQLFNRIKDSVEKSKIKYERIVKIEDSIQKVKDSIRRAENKANPKKELKRMDQEIEAAKKKRAYKN